VIVTVLCAAAPAEAHPTLLQTFPQAGYSYSESPVEIGLLFDQPVTIQRLTVLGQARGLLAMSKPLRSPDGTKITVVPPEPLPGGNYTVRWQITAEDGDIIDGTFDFGVGVRSATNGGQTGTAGTVGLEAVALLRWALFGGFALALGGLVGDAMVRDRARRARLTRNVELTIPRPWVLSGSILGLVAVVGLILVQIGRGNVLDGARRISVDRLTSSETGWLLLVELAGFLVSAVAVSRPHRWVALLGLVPVVVAEAWRSHLHAASPLLGSATIGLHFLVAALWVGVLIHIVRTASRWRGDRRQVVALFRRYATFALAGYLVVTATGVLAAFLVLPSWGALTSTAYGRVLLIKLTVVLLVSILALKARRGLRRSISAYAWGGLKFAKVERAGLVALLGVTALLTAVSPAPASDESTFPPPIDGPAIYLGNLAGQVSTGLIASEGRVQIRLHVPETSPGNVQSYRVRGRILSGGKTALLKLRPCGTGCFTAPVDWRQNQTVIALSVRASGWEGGDVRLVVPWSPHDGNRAFQHMLTTMARQPTVVLMERVTSNTARPEGMSNRLRLSGTELIKAQPYRSGVVSGVTVLESAEGRTELRFGLSAEDIYVRQTLDATGRLVAETVLTPNHLISRTFTYPGQGRGE